jgi:hypothetical protein
MLVGINPNYECIKIFMQEGAEVFQGKELINPEEEP